ncbi:MAG: DUF432 domain-containing protein [Ignisphaera sp.]|uniref:DUF432 domain-containing protein n=1 Tax=Ignisphaera aggregans TaxID=334771 RepID=A0A7C4JLH2_9CREN
MFGKELKGSLNIGMYRIDVISEGNGIWYKRYRGDYIEKEVLTKEVTLKLLPMYPIFYPKFLTKYLLCNLSTPIHIPPDENIGFYILLPVDIAVYSYAKHTDKIYSILDIIPPHKVYKYTLYGPLSRYGDVGGTIARYLNVDVFLSQDPINQEVGFCISHVEVRNKLKKFVNVTKLLLDSSPLTIFYEVGSWRCCTQHIKVTITGSSTAVVEYDKEPLEPGFKVIDDVEETKMPFIIYRTDMIWGF